MTFSGYRPLRDGNLHGETDAARGAIEDCIGHVGRHEKEAANWLFDEPANSNLKGDLTQQGHGKVELVAVSNTCHSGVPLHIRPAATSLRAPNPNPAGALGANHHESARHQTQQQDNGNRQTSNRNGVHFVAVVLVIGDAPKTTNHPPARDPSFASITKHTGNCHVAVRLYFCQRRPIAKDNVLQTTTQYRPIQFDMKRHVRLHVGAIVAPMRQ